MLPFAIPALGSIAARQIPWGKIIVGVVILLLIVACSILYYRMDNAIVRADAAERELKDARDDATRWQAAAEANAAIIQNQNAAIEATRLDLARANEIIDEAELAALDARAVADAEIRKWKEKARANPDQTRPLGPIARDALSVLVSPD